MSDTATIGNKAKSQALKPQTMWIGNGNEAVARAAMRAGCGFFAGYPITPASSILHYMLDLLPPAGGVATTRSLAVVGGPMPRIRQSTAVRPRKYIHVAARQRLSDADQGVVEAGHGKADFRSYMGNSGVPGCKVLAVS